MQKQSRPNFMLFSVWRLLAAGLVMIYHFSGYGPAFYQSLNLFMECLTPLLDMFFIISGFLIWVHYSDRIDGWQSFKRFIIRRFARIYPLHLLTLSFFCLIALTISFGWVTTEVPERYSLVELIKELLLINAWGASDVLAFNYVSWSISAEWFSYLLFPLLVVVYRRFGLIGLGLKLVAIIMLLEGATAFGLMPFPTWLEANTWGAYRVFADFTLGAILADCARRYPLQVRSHIWPWAVFALALIVMLTRISNGYVAIMIISASLFLAARVEMTAPERSDYLKPFLPVAVMSFGIYLWHPVLGVVTFGLVWRRFLEGLDLVPFGALMAFAMLATVGIAMVSALVFENPIYKWMLSKSGARKETLKAEKIETSAIPAE